MRRTHGFAPEAVIFISVARLAPVKNPQGVLQTFASILPYCPQARLVFVGEGPERELLEKEIESRSLTGKVILAGEQTNINDWLNMADVFVLLSKEESLPLALLEAKQVGLACIVSNVGDMPQQIKHGKNGFVCKPQDIMLASCLFTELYENPPLRAQMGEISLQETGTNLDSCTQYEQIYQQVQTH